MFAGLNFAAILALGFMLVTPLIFCLFLLAGLLKRSRIIFLPARWSGGERLQAENKRDKYDFDYRDYGAAKAAHSSWSRRVPV